MTQFVAYPDIHSARVKLYPGPSHAALRAGEDRECGLWYCLHALNRGFKGSGSVPLSLATNLVGPIYTRATFYRTLRAGEGLYWHLKKGGYPGYSRIILYGLDRVCRRLGVAPFPADAPGKKATVERPERNPNAQPV